MSVSLNRLSKGIQDLPSLLKSLSDIISDLEDQLNGGTLVYANSDGSIPNGTKKNDVIITADQSTGTITLQLSSGKSLIPVEIPNNLVDVVAASKTFKGFIYNNADPSLTNFPDAGDWGFFQNTATSISYVVANFNGTLVKFDNRFRGFFTANTPSTTDLPISDTWGIFTGTTKYVAVNHNAVIFKVALA